MKLLKQLAEFSNRADSRCEEGKRIVELILNAPRAAHRDNYYPGHLTGSAWVVDSKTSKVLLLHHAKLGRWLQPGGHADGEYDLSSVALREAREESGLTSLRLLDGAIFDIDIHRIPARAQEPEHDHYDVRYIVLGDSIEMPTINHESRGGGWFTRDELARVTEDESVLRMARLWWSHM